MLVNFACFSPITTKYNRKENSKSRSQVVEEEYSAYDAMQDRYGFKKSQEPPENVRKCSISLIFQSYSKLTSMLSGFEIVYDALLKDQ